MKRALYQMSLGLNDVIRVKGRVVMTWVATLLATAATMLAMTTWHDGQAVARQWRDFDRNDAVTFRVISLSRSEASALDIGWPDGLLDGELRTALAVNGTAAAVFQTYPEAPEYEGRIWVCMGSWPGFWSFADEKGDSGLLIGADVKDVTVGETVDLGAHTEKVIGRLPRGTTLLASSSVWEVPSDLNNSIVFLTSYAHFVDSAPPDYGIITGATLGPIMTWLRVYHWTPEQIDQLVTDVASVCPYRILPLHLSQRSDIVLMWTGALENVSLGIGLLGMALLVFVTSLVHTVRATLKEHGVHRLLGAGNADARVRYWAFVAATFAVPALLITVLWSLLPIPQLGALRSSLWWVAVVIVACAAVAVEGAVRTVGRYALTVATRGVE